VGAERPSINGADAEELSRAEVEARLRVYEDFAAKKRKSQI
jgi:hypothetical protein